MKAVRPIRFAAMALLFAFVTLAQVWAQGATQQTFEYTGSIQTFTAPYTGIYELKVWGAQGGNRTHMNNAFAAGGLGGYATCRTHLTVGETVYVYVGGQGGTVASDNNLPAGAGGWNGGGAGGNGASNHSGSAGGGGATHISKVNNQIIGNGCNFLGNTNYIIVAGGGGGAGHNVTTAGAGGGTAGGFGTYYTSTTPHSEEHYSANWYYNASDSRGARGGNGLANASTSCEGAGGGGGGYLGGNANVAYSTFTTTYQDAGGSGGNSAYNDSFATSFHTDAGQKSGNGQAQIKLLLKGSGTSSVPYLISSVDDWNFLADEVNSGTNYSGKYFQLTADIGTAQAPITRMVGVYSDTKSDCRPFSGTFDGLGHTLTVDYSSNDYETRTALFSYVKVATIRNLIVAGNCGTAGRAAGIVGESDESDGLNTITNCVSSVTISGGLVGGIALGGNVDIRGCLFNGTINGTSQSGGIVCWGQNVTKITNCFFAPQEGSSISGNTFYYNGSSGATLTNCYYTTALGEAQGTAATPTANKPSNIGAQTAVYSVSGITAFTNGLYRDGKYYCDAPVFDYTLSLTSATILGESKYVTTFYHGTLAYQLPAGALAYTAGKDSDKVVFYRIGSDSKVIPAGTAVIIVADSSDDIILTKLDSTDVTVTSNLLHGSDTDYTVQSGTAYVLGVSGGVLGFYPVTGNTVPAGKAYYIVN